MIADIYEIEDAELEVNGYYDIQRLKGLAYSFMTRVLNGKNIS